jgi:hypothetical protein
MPDECGFFYSTQPTKTNTFIKESFKGMKVNKERITILVGVNVVSTESFALHVFYISKNNYNV